MKKKGLILASALTVAAVSVALFANKPLTAEEALLLRNVEALADGEIPTYSLECNNDRVQNCDVIVVTPNGSRIETQDGNYVGWI